MEELKSEFPNFYMSSWSSPSTPLPNIRLLQMNSDMSKTENKDVSYPVSFSQRLRESQLTAAGAKSNRTKSRSSSLTAFERAKLMMRLRGGNEINEMLDKNPRKVDKKGGSIPFDSSGKYSLAYFAQ